MSKPPKYRRILKIAAYAFRRAERPGAYPGSRLNTFKVRLVLSLLAFPLGLLWPLFFMAFPNNPWVVYIVGGLSGVLIVSMYGVIIRQVDQGRWMWFAKQNQDTKPDVALMDDPDQFRRIQTRPL